MSKQQEVREAVRSLIDKAIGQTLHSSICQAQEQESAEVAVNILWPALKTEDLYKLLAADPEFLTQAKGVPTRVKTILANEIHALIEPELQKTLKQNKYTQGTKLQRIIEEAIELRSDNVKKISDGIFEMASSDRLANHHSVQQAVLTHINNNCLLECRTFSMNPDPSAEDEIKRHLKILSLLTNKQYDDEYKKLLLSELATGKTKSFPYVIRYMSYNRIPFHNSSVGAYSPRADVFTSDLLLVCPEASYVLDALNRFVERNGLVSEYVKVDKEVSDSLSTQFARLPDMVPSRSLFLPKMAALQDARRSAYSVTDGVTCAVSIAALLEWLIRQGVYTLGLGNYEKPRATELVSKLSKAKSISAETEAHLQAIFNGTAFALRDGLAHSAFFADNRTGINSTLGFLCEAVRLLVSDFQARAATVFTSARWDIGFRPTSAEANILQNQFQRGNNLLDQINGEQGRQHISKVLRMLTPDKWFSGMAALLFWVNTQHKPSGEIIAAKQFAAIVNGLVVFEELFRAVQEYHNLPILRVETSGSGLKCGLAMLDQGIGHLLHAQRLTTLFGSVAAEPEFEESLIAVVNRRNCLYHGKLTMLEYQKAEYMHLIMKFIFALSLTVKTEALQSL